MMVLEHRAISNLDVAELAACVAGLQRSIAEEGIDQARWQRAASLGEAAAELARDIVDGLPHEALSLLAAHARLQASRAVDGVDREDEVIDALEALHVALLAVRENSPVAGTVPIGTLVPWLTAELGVTQEAFASAVGIPARTLQRRLAHEGAMPPSEARRLRLAIRGLNDLRFTMTGQLALDWLQAPLPAAGGRRPVELLDEPDAFARAVMASRV